MPGPKDAKSLIQDGLVPPRRPQILLCEAPLLWMHYDSYHAAALFEQMLHCVIQGIVTSKGVCTCAVQERFEIYLLLGMMVYVFNPSTQETEAGGSI